jgi:DNA-directed RNA polymerase subunit RPC12/RpoP
MKMCKKVINDRVKTPYSKHEKAKYWHPTLNGEVTPNDISIYCKLKFWFKCPTCNHNFEQYIFNITKEKNPSWCPYCSKRKLCDDIDCNMCRELSFLSSPKINEWCYLTNDVNPRMVFTPLEI